MALSMPWVTQHSMASALSKLSRKGTTNTPQVVRYVPVIGVPSPVEQLGTTMKL